MYVYISPKQVRDLAEGTRTDREVLEEIRTKCRERREHLQRKQQHEWRRQARQFKAMRQTQAIHPITTTW